MLENKKIIGNEKEGDTNSNSYTRKTHQSFCYRDWKKTSGNQPDDSITKIGQNNEKTPGDSEETYCHSNSIENTQLTLVLKKFKGIIIMIIIVIIIIMNQDKNT